MNPDIWMPYYGADFEGDTKGFSREVRWSYLAAIWHYWASTKTEGLPEDDTQLMQICNCYPVDWSRTKPMIFCGKPFFYLEGGKWHQDRARKEYADAVALCARRLAASKVAIAARNVPRTVERTVMQSDNEPLNEPLNDSRTPSPVQSQSQSQSPKKVPTTRKPRKQTGEEGEAYSVESRILLHHLNEKSGRRFRETAESLEEINARLKEPDVTLVGCKLMIDRQCTLWKDEPKMCEYLRPSTLFNKTKFNSYYAARELPAKRYHESNTPQRVDRSIGTLNEGTAHLYEGMGRVVTHTDG